MKTRYKNTLTLESNSITVLNLALILSFYPFQFSFLLRIDTLILLPLKPCIVLLLSFPDGKLACQLFNLSLFILGGLLALRLLPTRAFPDI